MKQIVSNYSYSPATNVVTLTGVNIDADQLLLIVAPGVGRTMYNFASVTGVVLAGADTRVTLNASTAGLTTTSPLVIFYDDQASTQTVAGTVTADGGGGTFLVGGLRSGSKTALSLDVGTGYLQTKVESLPAISGTVTVGGLSGNAVTTGYTFNGTAVSSLPVIVMENALGNIGTVDVSSGSINVTNSVTIGSLPTVAPQFPRVTLIDGSGTVTTANTAITVFASSSTRSYLLVQVTTGSAFVNVGATATTVNGINLTAGQGYAWETTIPQGVVSLISTTTSSRYVAKEA